jgi:hypothetical protein
MLAYIRERYLSVMIKNPCAFEYPRRLPVHCCNICANAMNYTSKTPKTPWPSQYFLFSLCKIVSHNERAF